ncbi:hypothetical protein RhiirA5_427985 [Rhizophagus irregularis]|uniref:Uncharacterized protein n=1 Tax=Rhizophagus irregularis TaxID=588596 RepID=A0A2N0P165_9GLOM|nr:hypothetical protein RhiirA5_427985 [Rhizophagus irregularis]
MFNKKELEKIDELLDEDITIKMAKSDTAVTSSISEKVEESAVTSTINKKNDESTTKIPEKPSAIKHKRTM